MPEAQSTTLLLVEDDPGHARLIEQNLRRTDLPYDMVLMRDGQAALNHLFQVCEERGAGHPVPFLVGLLFLSSSSP